MAFVEELPVDNFKTKIISVEYTGIIFKKFSLHNFLSCRPLKKTRANSPLVSKRVNLYKKYCFRYITSVTRKGS
jgi:hypothetical protein